MTTAALLLLAVFLPWAVGVALVCTCWYERRSGYWLTAVGMGFPLGMVSVILGYYLFGQLGYGVHLAPNLYLQLGLLLLLVLFAKARIIRTFGECLSPQAADQWGDYQPLARYLMWAVVGWLVFRWSGIMFEVLLRPLFPWDAWAGLAVEAKVWFYNPDVFSGQYISVAAEPDPRVMWQGGTKHPSGLAFIWLWNAQIIGVWNDALVNVSWPILWGASALMMSGFLRLAGLGYPGIIISVALFFSLPMLSIQVLLAGYADFWISSLLLMVVGLLLLTVTLGRGLGLWVMVLIGCAGMLLLKQHGLLWVGSVLFGVALTGFPLKWSPVLMFAGVMGFWSVLWFGGGRIDFLPFGAFVWNEGILTIPGGRVFSMDIEEGVIFALVRHLYVVENWHLFWYLMPIILGLNILSLVRDRSLAIVGLTVWPGLFILLFLLIFTQTSATVIDGTSVNRLILHVVPSLCLLSGLILQRVIDRGSQ